MVGAMLRILIPALLLLVAATLSIHAIGQAYARLAGLPASVTSSSNERGGSVLLDVLLNVIPLVPPIPSTM